MNRQDGEIIESYLSFIGLKDFPCVGAKASLGTNSIRHFIADHMACPKDDNAIVEFLYGFIDQYRQSTGLFNSAVVIFRAPELQDEEMFDMLLWQRLQAISDIDSQHYRYDARVGSDPQSATFSFSLREEALYIIGLHRHSSRKARQFQYPAIVFNPHAQFESLRQSSKFEHMKQSVRRRDTRFSGSINPMLADFGQSSEVIQYSGRKYDKNWKCPFTARHENAEHNSAA